MATYKITNITNSIGKRELNYNCDLKIDYVDGMEKKIIHLKPKETIYLTINYLPLSLHQYRIKKMATIVEISEKELERLKKSKIKKNANPSSIGKVNAPKVTTTTTTKNRKSYSKSTSSKKTTSPKTSTSIDKTLDVISKTKDIE